ncbi:hypothetical protein OUZ56_010080 [Daphnia magna]|uniref:Uncharacterized protein n=1 Tax=Daphnia magna TaxID=35525 RepID=A0ABR0AI57_9CRUS|nr:hypothetical protein OUZ56_010080 [Daphnia magna]
MATLEMIIDELINFLAAAVACLSGCTICPVSGSESESLAASTDSSSLSACSTKRSLEIGPSKFWASPTTEAPLYNDEAGVGEVSIGTLDSSRSGCNNRLGSLGQLARRRLLSGNELRLQQSPHCSTNSSLTGNELRLHQLSHEFVFDQA